MKNFVLFLFVVVLAFISLLSLASWVIRAHECRAHWDQSGMTSRWSIMGGCQLHQDGRWIPERNFVFRDSLDKKGLPQE